MTAMKLITQTLSIGLLLMTLASCDTYVEGRGHTRSGYGGHGQTRTHSDRNHYDSRPSYRSSGPSINANTNIGAGLRL